MKNNKNFNSIKKIIYDKKMIISLICILLFIILSIFVFTDNTTNIENSVMSFMIGIRNNSLTKRMINITNIGSAYSLIVISLLLLIFIKNKKIPLMIIYNLIGVFLTSQLFKIIFRRERPLDVFLVTTNDYSFPSGHMMVSTAYIIVILYIIYKTLNNKLSKILISIFLIILVLLIGFSRMYLGVHYITDIISGLLLGISFSMIFIKLISKKGYIK